MKSLLLGLSLLVLSGCDDPPPAKPPQSASHGSAPAATLPKTQAEVVSPSQAARVGAPAPDFELTDLDGKSFKLSDYRGKTVVLEWFNPRCPFVRMSHIKGSLVSAAARHQKSGVVWLAINSGAPGKQGHGVETNRAGKQDFKLDHPVLLDESGNVGKSYGATNTPHMFVIDAKGTLVYAGAIDNSPDGEGESPSDGKLVNYVDQALAELAANKPISVSKTDAYGCSVKY